MNTLLTEPVASLIARLFADAQADEAKLSREMQGIAPQERQDMMRSATRYRELYGRLKDFYLAVSPETGRMLYMLARSSQARSIVEFGTSFGISTLHLAAALRDNGGGRLLGSEFEAAKVARARANLQAADLSDLVEIREGDALETLARDLPPSIDLVLLDGAKGLYPKVLALLEGRLRPGALVIADNADHSPEYLARVRAPDGGYLSVPFGGDVEVSLRM
jgi:predicted O-methyltransferase YrrM